MTMLQRCDRLMHHIAQEMYLNTVNIPVYLSFNSLRMPTGIIRTMSRIGLHFPHSSESPTSSFPPPRIISQNRDEHGQDWIRTEANFGRIKTGSGLKPILAGSELDRTAIFLKIGGQDWIGLRIFLLR